MSARCAALRDAGTATWGAYEVLLTETVTHHLVLFARNPAQADAAARQLWQDTRRFRDPRQHATLNTVHVRSLPEA